MCDGLPSSRRYHVQSFESAFWCPGFLQIPSVRRSLTLPQRRSSSNPVTPKRQVVCASAKPRYNLEENFKGKPRRVNSSPPIRLQHIPHYLGRRKPKYRTRPSEKSATESDAPTPVKTPRNVQEACSISLELRKKGNFTDALSVIDPYLDVQGASSNVLREYIFAYSTKARHTNPPLSSLELFERLLRAVQSFPGTVDSYVISAILSVIRTNEPSLAKHVLRKALDLVDYARSKNIALSSHNLASLFQICADARDLDAAVKIRYDVSTLLDVVSGSALISCFAKCGDVERADATMNELTSGGVPINERTFTPLISAYYRAGLHSKVLSTTDLALKHREGAPTIYLFSAVLQSCARVGDAVNARRYLELVLRSSVQPSEGALNSVLKAAVNGGDVKLAFDVLYRYMPQFMQTPKRDQVNQLITVCGRVGPKGGGGQKMVFHVLRTMASELNVSPDIGTFNAAISSLARSRNAQAARYVLEHEIPSARLVPNVLSYNATIHACGKVGRVYESFQLLCEMKDRALLAPTQSTYNTILNQCVQARDKRLVALVLQRMETENGIKLDSVSVASLIQMCRVENDPDGAVKILLTFKKHNGPHAVLDTNVYNSLITTCLELDRVDIAKGIAGFLFVSRRVNVVTFNVLIGHRCKQMNDLDGGVELLKRMKAWGVAPNAVTYSVLIQACASTGYLDRGFRLLSEMQDVGLGCTDTYPWTSLIDGCGRFGLWERALELLERMRNKSDDGLSRGLVPYPTTATYNSAIYAASVGGGGWHAVLDVYDMLKTEEQIKPDHITYSAMTSAILEHQARVRELDIVNEVLRGLLEEEERFIALQGNTKNLHLRRQQKKLRNKAKRLQWFLCSFKSQLQSGGRQSMDHGN